MLRVTRAVKLKISIEKFIIDTVRIHAIEGFTYFARVNKAGISTYPRYISRTHEIITSYMTLKGKDRKLPEKFKKVYQSPEIQECNNKNINEVFFLI